MLVQFSNRIEYLNNKFDGHGDEIKKIFEDLPKEYGNEKIKVIYRMSLTSHCLVIMSFILII